MGTDEKSAALERFLRGHEPFAAKPLYAPGETVGDWKVLAFLGRGGSGEVYRAENVHIGTIGALKALTREDAKARDRFRLEARLLSRATCAAFPRFCAYGEAEGRPYLVTELLEPMDLPSTDGAVADFIGKVCVGVAELHRLGYVHRDIKPANIMRRSATGEPVLIDLGLVKSSDEKPDGRNSTTSIVDGHAVGVGTPGYSAPEQFSGGSISPAADIHALGMLANACFKGKPPRPWAGIIRRSTSSIPEQRYASVELFVKAIRHRHRERRVAFWAIFFGVATLSVSVWTLMRSGGKHQAPSTVNEVKTQPSAANTVVKIQPPATNNVVKVQPPATNNVVKVQLPVTNSVVKIQPPATNNVVKIQTPVTNSVVKVQPPATNNVVKVQPPATNRLHFTTEELRQVFQDTSAEKIDPNVRIVKWADLGETKFANGMPVTTIWLDERTLKVEEPVTLKGKRKVYIVGPGLLNADISGAKGVTVEIARNAALINRSAIPYPKSGIVYTLRGESYLNFLNQKPPEDDNIRNVYVNGENEILDYGGPLTYREAREEAYKQNLEAYRRDAERRRKSHDLRDAGIHEAF